MNTFLELIATIFAGMAAAGMMLAIRHLVARTTGRQLAGWFIPVAAGAAMLAATISSEYGWYKRTSSALPEGFEVIETVYSKKAYRPWTYVWPYVERFAALDTAGIKRNDALPTQRLADVYLYGRWAPLNRMTVLADCALFRRAALMDAIEFSDDGSVDGAEWLTVAEDDPLMLAICEVA